ncbi:unnamed protein product [Hymenolepis diminuta]|uniref:Uncharacterized protein n=1 Tax=Hymenolepis diminuta TaxID=6216 RepID=A0A564YYB9_HYMDI|nr:unnamed protein product [Hymenolepis diminuta]
MCSQTNVPRSHIESCLAGTIRRISYQSMVDPYSKWSYEVCHSEHRHQQPLPRACQKVHHRKSLRSQYAAVSSESITDPTEIYLDVCHPPSVMTFRNSRDPVQSSARSVLQGGSNAQTYE